MPARDPLESPNRLRLGQGVPGGRAALPPLGSAAPPVPAPRRPVQPQRMSPPGYAVDVTPPGVTTSPEGRGAAMLRRGTFRPSTLYEIGPGQRKVLDKLRSDPKGLAEKDPNGVAAVVRAGPVMQAAIDKDPVLKRHQQLVVNHILGDPIVVRHGTPVSGSEVGHVATTAPKGSYAALMAEHQKPTPVGTDIGMPPETVAELTAINRPNPYSLGGLEMNAARGAGHALAGFVPGMYSLIRHPKETGVAIAKGYGQYYGPLAHGDLSKFAANVYNNPDQLFFDAAAGTGAAVGVSGRIAAANEAVISAGRAEAMQLSRGELLQQTAAKGLSTVDESGKFLSKKALADQLVSTTKEARGQLRVPGPGPLVRAGKTVRGEPYSLGDLPSGKAPPNLSAAKAFVKGFMNPKARGLLDAYEAKRGVTHETELARMEKEITDSLHPDARAVLKKVTQDLRENPGALSDPSIFRTMKTKWAETLAKDKAFTKELQDRYPGFVGPTTALVISHTLAALREVSDGVRAGAIYLRPAYLPNNWVGNAFMNLTHQGFLAPLNIGKSFFMDQMLGDRYANAIDHSLGQTAAAAVHGTGRGYVTATLDPLVRVMGRVADVPFRRAAWLHEARRAGYTKLEDIKGLWDKVDSGDAAAMREVAQIARKAQEEVVKFTRLNGKEQALGRNVFFVYSWTRGATRYGARYALQHPIQTAVNANLGEYGYQKVAAQWGGFPGFLLGSVPVGTDKNGNPILINPLALNPLGTAFDVARAIGGTHQVISRAISGKGRIDSRNLYDVLQLMNPVIRSYVESREGQGGGILSNIAAYRLYHDLRHPGTGTIFPGTRAEALGHFTFGSIYPRVASKQGIAEALQREHQFDPEAMIPQQVKSYKEMTGHPLPPGLVGRYRGDLQAVAALKDFQQKYADHLGRSSYRKLPPADQVNAALDWMKLHGPMGPEEVDQIKQEVKNIPNDQALTDLASSLWSATGVGEIKRLWAEMFREAKRSKKTPALG